MYTMKMIKYGSEILWRMVNSGWGTIEVLPDKVKLRWTAKLDVPAMNGSATRDSKLTEKLESATKKC